MDNNENKSASSFAQLLIVILAVFLLFFSGSLIGTLGAKPDVDKEENIQVQETVATTQEATTQATSTTAPITETTTLPAVTESVDSTTEATTAATTAATEENTAGVPSTKAEIVAFFNESANKVKTDATKVIKNYEYRTHLEEYLEMPKALEGMAGSLMSSVFKDDLEPIEYATREEIMTNYQVPGVDWVSQLTEADVAEATCTDNGTEYEVMLKLYPTKDPEPGKGVAKAFDTITPAEIKENAPSMLQTFSTEYFDCVVKCKIDKSTGYTTWANYTSPLIMDVTVKMGVTMDARMGLCFEKDYTIIY